MLLALLMSGCFHSPVALAPSSAPVPEDAERGEWRTAERCDSHLFGLIPLDEPMFLQGVLADAGARVDRPLLGVTVDRRDVFWLFGTTRCTRVSGWISELPEPEQPKASVPVDPERSRTVLFAIYSNLEATPPLDEQRELDLRAVSRALEAGVPDLMGQVMDRSRARPGTPVFILIAQILDAHPAASPPRP
jgi:hypothetical protein